VSSLNNKSGVAGAIDAFVVFVNAISSSLTMTMIYKDNGDLNVRESQSKIVSATD
jgi:hypothetical protein